MDGMREFLDYPKIDTMYHRDPANKMKTLLIGQWSKPEFEYLKKLNWRWREKIDGTNIKAYWNGFGITLGGRTKDAVIDNKTFLELDKCFNYELLQSCFGPNHVILYGEGCGIRINKHGKYYNPLRVEFKLFDVLTWDSQSGQPLWFNHDQIADVANKLVMPVAPELGYGTLLDASDLVQASDFLSKSVQNPKFIPEGLVMVPAVEMRNRRGERIITKIKVKDFGLNRDKIITQAEKESVSSAA